MRVRTRAILEILRYKCYTGTFRCYSNESPVARDSLLLLRVLTALGTPRTRVAPV